VGKRKKTKLTREFWERDAAAKKKLQERIEYHERKLAEERAAGKRAAG
jgi:hypothetical protein